MSDQTERNQSDTEARNLETLEAGFRSVQDEQDRRLIVNVDEAWAEHKKKDQPFVFSFDGKEYKVPTSMPADFGRFYRRHCLQPHVNEQNGEAEVLFVIPSGDLMFEFMETMIGREFAEAFEKTRIPLAVIAEAVIGPIMREWKLYVEPVEDGEQLEKKNQTPAS